MRLLIISKGILKIPFLNIFLSEFNIKSSTYDLFDCVAAWGYKSTSKKTIKISKIFKKPCFFLEDGFLRSFGTGQTHPPLSLILDRKGAYYNANNYSELEVIICKNNNILDALNKKYELIREIKKFHISKYNSAPDLNINNIDLNFGRKILVVDQTAGDMSVSLGAADKSKFKEMLEAALLENPEATIYLKTHPEVTSGRKGGYLTHVQPSERVVVLRDAVNPMSLIKTMDKVYVVTSTMGFEALLAGKPVTCFGVPWYSGWGVTDDRQPNHPAMQRRAAGTGQKRSVEELFAAAYLQYSRYLNPYTHERGEVQDVMDWLIRQRATSQRFAGRMIGIGFRRWKAVHLRPLLSLFPEKVHFVTNVQAAAVLQPGAQDCLVVWGARPPETVLALGKKTGARVLRVEDGFVRSVGLGSDLIAPRSIVLDGCGMYFDPAQPSELENMLNTLGVTQEDIQRAQQVREFVVKHRLTKYNLEPLDTVHWPSQQRQVVLVPGQVEDDASIRTGCDPQGVCTNLSLLQAARAQFPDAYLVYKPHPDVASGNRRGALTDRQVLGVADCIERRASVVSCIEACDVVVTMTSLTGFDALLRDKHVVVHGRPFYAGWGLTEDKLPQVRRQRSISLDELVACALLHYPIYWDPVLKGYTTCEAVLLQLQKERDALLAKGRLESLRSGYCKRQWRKLRTLLQGLRRH